MMRVDPGVTASDSARLPYPDRLQPARCAYFLDFDGTLVEIALRPSAVKVAPELPALMAELHTAAGGALALISGRPLADIDRMVGLKYLPVAGQHGSERRDARGQVHVHPVDVDALSELRTRAQSWCATHPGLALEDKGLSIALHYRTAPELAAVAERLVRDAIGEANADFHIQTGKMVFEIKPTGPDKGRAIEAFLSESPFAGRLPVFIGDDVTDEHGFDAVNARGGVSIKVGDGASAARWRLQSVADVHRWLRSAIAG
jgi:trehalose 6-phosphate phosphatase